MKNALERIRIYYGEKSKVWIESKEGQYTKVTIQIRNTTGGQE